MKGINDAVRFLVELAVLAAVGYWGFHDHSSWAVKLVLGVGGPVLIATAWGIWMAPQSNRRAPEGMRALLEVLIFALATALVASTGGACRHLPGRCHSERSAGPRSRQDVTDRSCGLSPTAAASTLSLWPLPMMRK